jgi:hypothetical protein
MDFAVWRLVLCFLVSILKVKFLRRLSRDFASSESEESESETPDGITVLLRLQTKPLYLCSIL